MDEDPDYHDTGGTGAGVPIAERPPAEPGFSGRFSKRFRDMPEQDVPNFHDLELLIDDVISSMKEELNFKSSPGDEAVQIPKIIDPDNHTEIQNMYRRNRKKPYVYL